MHKIASTGALRLSQSVLRARVSSVYSNPIFASQALARTISRGFHSSQTPLDNEQKPVQKPEEIVTKIAESIKEGESKLKNATQDISKSKKGNKYSRSFKFAVFLAGAGLAVYLLDLVVNDDFDLVTDRFRQKVPEAERATRPRVIILGTGWAALSMLRKMHTDEMQVTVVSPRNYFMFTPMLPSTTTGTVELRSIVEPIRKYCHRSDASEITFLEAECTAIDPNTRKVTCKDTSPVVGTVNQFDLEYDHLVIAVGADNATFNVPGVKEHACFMKEVEDSRILRDRILDCFETANYPGQPLEEIKRLLHFIVVGGGPSGIEFTAELTDFLHSDLVKSFPHLADKVQVSVIEALPHLLNVFDARVIEFVEKSFSKNPNIQVLTKTSVTDVAEKRITVKTATGEKMDVPYGLLMWATGNAPRKVIQDLMKVAGPELQNCRRGLTVDDYFRVKGLQNVWALGDCTCTAVPATAQVASQEGRFLGRLMNQIAAEMHQDSLAKKAGKQSNLVEEALKNQPKFVYNHFGSFAYVGDHQAVAELGSKDKHVVTGVATFFLWRSVYLSKLLSAKNRVLVAFDWGKAKLFGRDISRA